MFFTDNWKAFSDVLPPERHIIGKKHTHTIERDNSNTRHHLGRMTRRTKVVSQKKEMVDLSLKLWLALTDNETFKKLISENDYKSLINYRNYFCHYFPLKKATSQHYTFSQNSKNKI